MPSHGMTCNGTQFIFSNTKLRFEEGGKLFGYVGIHVIMGGIGFLSGVDVEPGPDSQVVAKEME